MRNCIPAVLLSVWFLVTALFGSPPASATEDDPSANVTIEFVTDLSGSMKTGELDKKTQAFLTEFMKELYPGDRVMLSTFGDSAVVGRPSNISTMNRDNDVAELVSEINGYSFSQNHTYTSGSLAAACPALNRQQGPKVLVLITDGKEEIPSGSPPLWDDLPKACDGIAIHVIALTNASKPTVDQVAQRLKAIVHDATQKSLAQIGEDIRKGIRVFVVTSTTEFELGNLQVGTAGEIRAAFTVSGASQAIELKPVGESFPAGATLNCQNFKAPGDARCELTVTDALAPGTYTGTIRFEPTAKTLAVDSPKLTIKFSRGQLHVGVQENIWFGSLKPGQTKSITVAFTSDGPASPRSVKLNLAGFPEGAVQFSPSEIQVPADNVEFMLTFVDGAAGDYTGQLSFQPADASVVVEPAVISVGFRRQSWLGENWWKLGLAGLVIFVVLRGLWHRFIVVPRKRAANQARLKGRLVRLDQTEVKLDSKLTEQTIGELTFTATGTLKDARIAVTCRTGSFVCKFPDGSTRTSAALDGINLVDRTEILASDGTVIGTFLCLGLRK